MIVDKHVSYRRLLIFDHGTVALWWKSPLDILHACAVVIWMVSSIIGAGLQSRCYTAPLPDISWSHLSGSPIVMVCSAIKGFYARSLGAPRHWAIEAGRDAIGTAYHLGCRSQQVISRVVEESIINIGTSSPDHGCWVLRLNLSMHINLAIVILLVTIDGETILSQLVDVIWTSCRILRHNRREVSLLVSHGAKIVGARLVLEFRILV